MKFVRVKNERFAVGGRVPAFACMKHKGKKQIKWVMNIAGSK